MEFNSINSAETGYSLLIQYTKTEIKRIQEVISQGQKMESALQKSLDSLQSIKIQFSDAPTEKSELDEKLQNLREPGYPYKEPKEAKIIFLINKMNTVAKVSELTDDFMRIEGKNDGRTISKSLHYKMNQMVADGKLVVAKWFKSKQIFYALPSFFSSLEKGNVQLKAEHLPKPEAWGKIPESDQNFNKARWTFFIKAY